MKIILLGLFAVLISFVGFHLGANSHGGTQFRQMHSASEAPATGSMRQNDFALCGQPFYDDVYALTVEIFAEGAENVNLDTCQEQVFALVDFQKNTGAMRKHSLST